jgi:pyruvate dehydrogenase E2 component (dihydrolipoamide acetyltransferase)
MANPVIMPRQGQSVESCIISSWNKKEGDPVAIGDILFSYETDKAAFECESAFEGILLKRLFGEGDEVPVLETVAFIGEAGEAIQLPSQGSASKEAAASAPVKEETTGYPGPDEVHSSDMATRLAGERIAISPRAKNRAERTGIEFAGIAGTGPQGRIIETDIIRAAGSRSAGTPLASALAGETGKGMPVFGTGVGSRVTAGDLTAPASAADDSEIRKLSNMRKIIAARMQESLANSAQLTHHTSADARKLLELRSKAKAAFEKGAAENITINDLVCYAVIRALKKHPAANSHFLGDSTRVFSRVHLGIAVDTERGLMVPTVRNADTMTISELAAQLKAVAGSCKKGNVNPELLASESATFSVSNLGAYGVELFTPVINLPQVGILGVNTIILRPAELGNGVFGFVPHIGLSLTYDHRALDGAPASAFLREIRTEIENLEISI